MAASQVDALQSFTHLTNNIPQWVAKLDDIITKCEIQYERFTRITAHGEVKLTRKKKHYSTESLRPSKDVAAPVSTPAPAATTTSVATLPNNKDHPIIPVPTSSPPRPPDATYSDGGPPPEPCRKRPAGSTLSGAFSNHPRYRTKSMIIVYYDSDIQGAFDTLVKNVAGARNNLRKGKNTATFQARMASMGMPLPSPPAEGGVGLFPLPLDPKMMTPALARARLGRQGGGSGMKPFEDADRDLEEAQSLCERAAHQFLRDGDCHTEIEGTRKRFQNCESIARREVERLRAEQATELVKEGHYPEDEPQEQSPIRLQAPTPPAAEDNPVLVEVSAKLDHPPLKEFGFAGAGTIEIDDGIDTESVKIDLAAIRRTVRSTRA
ncbi:MAG: hypothetical protein Q9163_006186 [Psora crenata]